MKILIVSKIATHPMDAGNKHAILAQAKILKEKGNDVHFLYVNERPLAKKRKFVHEKEVSATKGFWKDRFHLFTVSWHVKLYLALVKQIRKFFFHRHFKVDDQYPFGLSRYVKTLNKKYHFDICIIHYFYLSRLLNSLPIPKKAIYTHDCMAYKDIKFGIPFYCTDANTEAKAMQRCPHIFAIQNIEADYFHLLSPRSFIYTIYDIFTYHKQFVVGNHVLVFLSGSNIFNQNGINWFVKDILPSIRRRFPDTKLIIGGGICKVIPQFKNIDGIELQGYIDDVNKFYSQGDVCINPCYQGTGLKIKTIESISYDKVTMVHPHSQEGIFDKSNAPLFASVDPAEWVKFLESIWENPSEIEKIKEKDKAYLDSMEDYISNEYDRFLKA